MERGKRVWVHLGWGPLRPKGGPRGRGGEGASGPRPQRPGLAGGALWEPQRHLGKLKMLGAPGLFLGRDRLGQLQVRRSQMPNAATNGDGTLCVMHVDSCRLQLCKQPEWLQGTVIACCQQVAKPHVRGSPEGWSGYMHPIIMGACLVCNCPLPYVG
jgi:hypothetical protein